MYNYSIEDKNGCLLETMITDEEIMENYDKYYSIMLTNDLGMEVYMLDLETGRFFFLDGIEAIDITPLNIEAFLNCPPYKIIRENRAIILNDKIYQSAKTLGYETIACSRNVQISLVCWEQKNRENEFEIDMRDVKCQAEST